MVARKRDDDGNLGLPLLLIVDVDSPGAREAARSRWPCAAPTSSGSSSSTTSRCPAERLIGESEEVGLKAAFDGLNPERIMGAALSNGIGRRALELASGYARERVVWNQPIGAHQGISHPLAQAKIELELARLMTQKAAALYDAGAPAGEAANMAKYAAAEAAIHCVDQAIQTHGGNGFALEYGLTDMYWGARVARTAPVSREMVLNYVAEHSLGLAALLLAGSRPAMAEQPTLYVCHGDDEGPRDPPLPAGPGGDAREGDRLREGDRRPRPPDPVPAQGLARRARAATGDTKLPALKLADGTVITHSKAILRWVDEQP